MGKGIKMRSAKDRTGRAHTVEELQQLTDGGVTAPDLLCNDSACGCAVRFVPRHQQNRTNRVEPVDIPAYIGLTRGSEHVTGCRYSASGRLTIIAAQSDPEFLSALGDGTCELRLLALHNGLRKHGLSGNISAVKGSQPAPSTVMTAIEVIASEKKFDSYLRTTADLVVLRATCESDALLASELILQLGSRRIPWKRFFFEHERFDEAWELGAKAANNPYPIALVGSVRSVNQPATGATYKNSYLNCKPLYRRTSNPQRIESFEVSIAHPDASWLSSFPPDAEIVMFGIWKVAAAVEKPVPDRRDNTRIITYVTHKLQLTPKFKKQIITIP
ncbi:hypothetical protein [Pollutimonas bauzanensis]|uniref:Uncharacterized protein n=1 Tax=Pollutimonas bauzanensis TaxID=658167 RepID=A0A1M6A0F3_9BURK|nr:hypothetical protein [Pollutimonas bauzanensis]SHI29809.1 hypothetical protein SAMN04488135_12079 [Pollutimonas bauzanensis]